MVTFFVAVVFGMDVIAGLLLLIGGSDDGRIPYLVGWLLGSFTTATAYILFIQLFPHICL